MRSFFLVLPLLLFFRDSRSNPTASSQQIVVSVTDNWSTLKTQVAVYERSGKTWNKLMSFPAVVGKLGLGWGVGKHNQFVRTQKGDPIKHEGDKKAPAGVFELVQSFGYDKLEGIPGTNPRLPQYFQVDEHSRCVDDYKSKYYNNQVFDEREVKKDWDSHERLRRDDVLYKLAIVVDHNRVNVKSIDRSEKLGSCIFLHIWRGADSGTAGCTAFSQEKMLKLYSVLDSRKKPLLVQLPKSEYIRYSKQWGLPSL